MRGIKMTGSGKTPQKVFVVHDIIGQQVGVIDH